jgi:predicted MFS family arabinose efflux permease
VLSIWQLYGAVFVVGALGLFFDVAYRSYLPSLVRRDQLLEGNGKLEVGRSAAEVGGPGLAGGLVQLFSAPLAVLFDAVSFLVSAVFLAGIKAPEQAPGGESGTNERRVLAEAVEGVKFLVGDVTLRALVACTGTISFFNAALEAVLVVYLVRELGLSAATVGLIFGIGGAGFLVGALLSGRVTRRIPLGTALVGGPVFMGAADLLIPLAGGSTVLSVVLPCAAQFLFGVGLPIYRVNEVSLRQTITPDRFLGRINSGERFVSQGVIPFGAIIGGVVAGIIGLRYTLALAAVGEILALLWILFSPIRSLRDHPQDAPS